MAQPSNTPILVGILNVTPDSFSDGGKYVDPLVAIEHGKKLFADGADIIDIGGVSTRPGSSEITIEEEWKRISPVVQELLPYGEVSVDTYRAEVAKRALQVGVKIINNVFPFFEKEIFSLVAEFDAKLVAMHSRCSAPHVFSPVPQGDIVERVKGFFAQVIEEANAHGLSNEKLILDSGMGGFVSDAPNDSWELIHRFGELACFGVPLYFGSSRKGFLKCKGEQDVSERDALSAFSGYLAFQSLVGAQQLHIRTHNILMQKSFFEVKGL
ncbi:MAG: dihydropteroate synthase [Bdellovibrionales bacterium]|nr:dihydropteroate synthase [Bdellovibrionales bacterium]